MKFRYKNKIIIIIYISVIYLIILIVLSGLGYIPYTKARVDLTLPLYPVKSIYESVAEFDYGHGIYSIIIVLYVKGNVTIYCDNNYKLKYEILSNETLNIEIFCSTNLDIKIEAFVPPLTNNIGFIEVDKRWIG